MMKVTDTDKSTWQTVRFGDMVHHISERVQPDDVSVDRYVGLEHLDPESLKIRRWGSPEEVGATKLRFYPGDIIFGKRRFYQRKLAVADFEGICSAHAMVLRAKPDVVLPEFLPFFMQSEPFFERAMSISVGSLSPTINWSTLQRQEFALPPLAEQRRIAEVLTAVEETNRKWENVLVSLNKLRDVLSFELFGHHGPEIPEVKCSDLCDEITVGIVVKPASYYVDNGGVPALRSLNVFPNRYDLQELVYLSQSGHKQHSKSQLRRGDLLVVRTGRPGDAAIVNDRVEGFNCIDLIIVRTGQTIRSHYLMHFFNSAAGRKELTRLTAGTAQKHLNVTALNDVQIPVRSLEAQDFIIKKFGEIDSRIGSADFHLQKGLALKKTLLNQLLSSVLDLAHV